NLTNRLIATPSQTRDLHEARTSLIKAETSKTHLEQQVEELSRRLQGDAERLAVYERRSAAVNGTAHHIGAEGPALERQLEAEVADLRASLKVAEVDLAAARNHIQQFKEISQASEEALASLNATHDQYKSTTEAQLSASWVWSSRSRAQQEELQSTLKNVEQELEQARTTLAVTKHVFESAREEWQADKKTLEDTIVDMAAAEKDLAEDRSSRESDARAHEERVKAAEERYSREVISHTEAIKVVEDLKRRLHDLQMSERNTGVSAETAQAKLATSESSWSQQRQALDREIADLAARCKALTEQNDVLHKHLDNVSSQAARIRQTAYLRKEKEIVDMQLELGKQENGRLKTQIGYLTRDLEDTRATLSDERERAASSAGTDAQHAELVEKIQQLNLLRERNATLRADSEAHAKRWRELDDVRLKALIQELDPLREGARTMQAELDARKEHIGRLEEENRRWQERNNQSLIKVRSFICCLLCYLCTYRLMLTYYSTIVSTPLNSNRSRMRLKA
ncbi:TPR/MLP1/MLP2-like protein-domain-containing protein, partial [Russula dissimulans]